MYLGQDFREGEVTTHEEWRCSAVIERLSEKGGFELGPEEVVRWSDMHRQREGVDID